MRKAWLRTLVCFGSAGVAGALTTDAHADFTYSNFASTAGLTLVGNAGQSGNSLRLTPASGFQTGATWHQIKQEVADGFRSTFVFRVTNPGSGGADGFAFVIQNSAANAIGGSGCQNGFDGIPNSLAIEFDTWFSDFCQVGFVGDPNDNHVSILTRGLLPNSVSEQFSLGATTSVPDFSDGAAHVVEVLYQDGVLSVFVDDLNTPAISVAVDLSATLGLDAGTAWVGFTAATGGAIENHDIESWSFEEDVGAGTGPYRPNPPIITEPVFDGKIVNAADVHMETAPFFDKDFHQHLSTDWEIWTVSPSERVWAAENITNGALKVHIHLGDGEFLGSYAGRNGLVNDTDYRLRARFRDNGADAATEYSFWSQRAFRTGVAGQIFGLLLKDVQIPPAIDWRDDTNAPVVLPPAGSTPASLTLDSGVGDLTLVVRALDGISNQIVDSPGLAEHVLVRIVASGGDSGLLVRPSTFKFLNEDCEFVTLYLPALDVPAGQTRILWASENGSTYFGDASQTHPEFNQLARGSLVPWTPIQTDVDVDLFATGFQLPVGIAFAPPSNDPAAPFFYVAELYGTIKTVRRDGTLSDYAAGLLNFNPTGDFPGSGEMGLACIATDPATGDLFATLLYANNGNTSQLFPRVIRLSSSDGGFTASSIQTVLDMPFEYMSASHQISNITVGPDGMLYVHIGDGFDPGTSQNLNSFRGKILRLTKQGAAPVDNPFYNAGDGITARDYVYASGVRNAFGGGWRLSDARHFFVENGPSVDRLALLVAGRNYGWDGSDASMFNYALYNWIPAHAPVNVAVIQPEVFGGSGFPPEKFGTIVVTESGPTWAEGPQSQGKRLVEFRVDSNGVLVSGPTTIVEYGGSGRGTAVALAAGPDGIYFSDLYKDLDYQSPIDRGSSVFRVKARVAADCNANGVDDACDINRQTSPDANLNGVPDECECVADFDGTGFVDTDDFDAFVRAFETGTLDADVDGSGFVDTDDYDTFVGFFEAGC